MSPRTCCIYALSTRPFKFAMVALAEVVIGCKSPIELAEEVVGCKALFRSSGDADPFESSTLGRGPSGGLPCSPSKAAFAFFTFFRAFFDSRP